MTKLEVITFKFFKCLVEEPEYSVLTTSVFRLNPVLGHIPMSFVLVFSARNIPAM